MFCFFFFCLFPFIFDREKNLKKNWNPAISHYDIIPPLIYDFPLHLELYSKKESE